MADTATIRLRHNRAYMLIWAGQGLSELGSQLSTVAYPLLTSRHGIGGEGWLRRSRGHLAAAVARAARRAAD